MSDRFFQWRQARARSLESELERLEDRHRKLLRGPSAAAETWQRELREAEAFLWNHVRTHHAAEEIARVEALAGRINDGQKGRITLFRFITLDIARARREAYGDAGFDGRQPKPAWLLDGAISQDYVQFAGVPEGAEAATFETYARWVPLLWKAGVRTLYVQPHYPEGGDTGYSIQDMCKTRDELAPAGVDGDTAFQEVRRRYPEVNWMIDMVPSHVDADHPIAVAARRGDKAARQQVVGVYAEDLLSVEPYAHPRTGEAHVRYRIRGVDAPTERNLEFPDRRTHHLVDHGDGYYSHHTFTSRQFDLRGHEELNILMVFRFLGHWIAQGIHGIRADAVPFWYKPWGVAGKHEGPSHALNELYVDFARGLEPGIEWAPEIVAGTEIVARYGGSQVSVHGEPSGSEATALWNFELAQLTKDAVALRDVRSLRDYLSGRRHNFHVPAGVKEILPAHKHDEYEIGFSPERSRERFKAKLKACGGWVSDSGWSGGGRLRDLFDDSPERLGLYLELLCGLPGVVSLYQGDLFGARTNWRYAWKLAGERLEHMKAACEIPAAEAVKLERLLASQDPGKQPHDPALTTILDVRDLHRGPVPERLYEDAEAGRNPFYNRLSGILPVRNQTDALARGDRESLIPTLTKKGDARSDVIAFVRESLSRAAPSARVLVVANVADEPAAVSFASDRLGISREMPSHDLKGRTLSVEVGQDTCTLQMRPCECLWIPL